MIFVVVARSEATKQSRPPPSFRGDAKHRTRNLEIPRCAIAHLWSGPSDHPGMTESNPAPVLIPKTVIHFSGSCSSPSRAKTLAVDARTGQHLGHRRLIGGLVTLVETFEFELWHGARHREDLRHRGALRQHAG